MYEKQLEINLDGNEQLEIAIEKSKPVDNTNCSKLLSHKVYVANTKKQKMGQEKTL